MQGQMFDASSSLPRILLLVQSGMSGLHITNEPAKALEAPAYGKLYVVDTES